MYRLRTRHALPTSDGGVDIERVQFDAIAEPAAAFGGQNGCAAILNNRVYIGETTHKGASYPGEHDAIVSRELFDAVRQRLGELAPPLTRKSRAAQDGPFAGLLFDETGAPMLPTYTLKRGRVQYRYYASAPTLKGRCSKAAISRIPAPQFEAYMCAVIQRLGLWRDQQHENIQAAVDRIDIQADCIVLRLHPGHALTVWRAASTNSVSTSNREIIKLRQGLLTAGESITNDGKHIIVSLPVRARFRGGRTTILYPAGSVPQTTQPDMALIRAVARAHLWRQMLLVCEVTSIHALAARFDLDRGHVGLTLKLASVSPELTQAILRGVQPPGLRLSHLLSADIPLSWERQREIFRGSPAR